MSTWLVAAALSLLPQSPTDAPHVEWQRTLADALAVQQATGKPLLICVNTDGEQFCDRFANETYVDPEFVATTRGWICVVASPDRHTKTDYDGLGRRVECPRFPGCTCSEHIAIEPELFARWFKGQRYAPRHVGVDKAGKILFDHFLDRSMQEAVDDIAQHKGSSEAAAVPTDAAALLRRRDAASRRALEAMFAAADSKARAALLARAAAADNEPVDLLRAGLHSPDAMVFAATVKALCAQPTAAIGIDLQDALARCSDAEVAPLVAACAQVAKGDKAMAQFVAHRRAALDGIAAAERFRFGAASPAPTEREAIEAALDAADAAARKAPGDGKVLVQQALANLALARFLLPSGDSTTPLWFEDARRAAERAEAHAGPAELPAALAVQAIALQQQGKAEDARNKAALAMQALTKSADGFDAAPAWIAEFFGAAARSAAAAAYAAVTTEPTAIAADAVQQAATAFAALARHPAATAADVREAAALLAWAGARQSARQLLEMALPRWPGDRELHGDLRARLLADVGADELLRAYATFAEAAADAATAEWFAGYASLVAAEQFVSDRRRDDAIAAYGDAIDRFGRSGRANGDFADSANHFAVLAHAGRALELHLAGRSADAVADLEAAAALRPASLGERDGLGRTPEAMRRRIARELREQGKADLAARLPD